MVLRRTELRIGNAIATFYFDMPARVEFWVAPPKTIEATISRDRSMGSL